MIKSGIIIFTLFFGIISSIPGYCQNPDQKEKLKRVTGTVADIDWVAGKIVIRTTNFGAADEITFLVSGDTQITNGTSAIGFSEINLSGAVTVEYFSDSFGGLKAAHITIAN